MSFFRGKLITKALYNFVEGKTKERGKKNAVNEFMKVHSEYKADREGFMVRVIIKIADFHAYISQNRDGVYVTKDGFELAKTLDECVDKLKKPTNRDVFQDIESDIMKILTNDYE